MSETSNRRKSHHVRLDTGPLDELIVWVVLVEILVFGTFGLAQLLKWLVPGL